MTSFARRLDTFFTLSREVNLAREADRRIPHLIRKWLKAGVSEDGQWSETKLGTPQGSVASPLLANAYLHYLCDYGLMSGARKWQKATWLSSALPTILW
jgi:retron-type reverse transcriptase